MNDSPLTPTPLLKVLTTVARWSLGMLLLAWILFLAAWGSLHWIIVPRIDEFRPQLESKASRLLGVPVRIGAITATSNGLIPSFVLSDVALIDERGRPALKLPRVLAALSPRSMWRLGFEQLVVERPELDIRRAPNGKIYVAGLDFSQKTDSGHDAVDWFFSQVEFAIHDGTIVWTDEQRDVPVLVLRDVDVVVRNKARRHDLRLDATPPPAWGKRFSLMGSFTQPLFARQNGQWRDWKGQFHGDFERVDLAQLRRYADIGVDLQEGNGAVRVWADVSRGEVLDVVADMALAQVSVTLAPRLQALQLQSVRGRIRVKPLASGFDFSTMGLEFDSRDGLHWPGGNVSVIYRGGEGGIAPHGALTADKLDLAVLSQIANRLPIEPAARAALLRFAPTGLVQKIQASWQGPLGALEKYEVKGKVNGLGVAAGVVGPAILPNLTHSVDAASPGFRGINAEFDFNQLSGSARVSIANGGLEFPGMFDEPEIPISQLSTDIKWQVQGDRIAVQLPNLKFGNADAQGEARVKWETSDPAKSDARARFPGVLDLQGTLSRGDATRVYRYMPTVIPQDARHYVRDAVKAGAVSGVKFRVKGDLHDMPYSTPKQGEFRISANIQNARLAYVPRSLQVPDELAWPALGQLSGELVIDGLKLAVRQGRGRMGATSGVQFGKVEALIPDLMHAAVTVEAEARGPMGEALGIVNGSPLGSMIGNALGRATASAVADYRFKLMLPIADLAKSKVQGSVTLAGNDIQITPETPKLQRARGVINFSESGFSINGSQARMLGGDVRLEGGMAAVSAVSAVDGGTQRPSAPVLIKASGTASAEGLRQATELGFVARLAKHASGAAAYSAVLGFRHGEPELLVSSDLQGMGITLPPPFNKSAETVLAFRLENMLLNEALSAAPGAKVRLQDQLTINVGRLASVVYFRDLTGNQARATRGSIGIGLARQEAVLLPNEGVAANVNLDVFDVDAWNSVLAQVSRTSLADVASTASTGPRVPEDTGANAAASSFLPTSLAVRTRELTVAGRKLNHLVLGASRDGLLWRANLDARELNGYLEYRQSSDTGPGRVYARLVRLTLAPGLDREVEAILHEQPASIPALDIVIDDFEMRGKRLGRVEVEAVNRGTGATAREGATPEWRLNKFNVVMPEAVLTATGNWVAITAQTSPLAGPRAAFAGKDRRRTAMNFKLDIADSGALLERLGMEAVVRKGKGKMQGQIAWLGSPLNLDYPSLAGNFTINVEAGQFLKVEPGMAKLLGVLSLQSLPRRLTLDFRDVFSEGFAFDFLRGDITIAQGVASTNNLQMKGVNAAVLMEGRADIAKETQDLKVVVIPEINAGTASLIASVINPAIGVGTLVAQWLLKRPLTEAATREFHVDGSWTDPKITRMQRGAPYSGNKAGATVDNSNEVSR